MAKFRVIPGFNDYQITHFGLVRNIRTGRLLKQTTVQTGHKVVRVKSDQGSWKTMGVHRLVLIAFMGWPPFADPDAAHFDGNPANNSLLNLRWATRLENQADRLRHGTDNRGEKHPLAKLTNCQVRTIAEQLTLRTRQSLADEYQVQRATISMIATGRNWSSVTGLER